jgi:hypothetical protein
LCISGASGAGNVGKEGEMLEKKGNVKEGGGKAAFTYNYWVVSET